MNYHVLLQKVEDNVNLFFTEHQDAKLFYHNLFHTRDVAEAAKQIATYYQFDDRSWFIVCAAAWFHDTGYLITKEDHELKSAELAKLFLKSIGINEDEIAEVKNCIMATKMPQQPASLADKIICDADLFYFGTHAFKEKNKLLKKEFEAIKNSKIDADEWRAETIKILEAHTYHTDYCRSLLEKTKAENLDKLKTKQQENLPADTGETVVEKDAVIMYGLEVTPENKKIPGPKKQRPEKGIESMFRIAATNNVRVSAMADNKAHIMITVNAIIISVILGLTVRNITEYKTFLIPVIILLTVSVVTVIYALLATRPKISNGIFTAEQVEKKSVNLLYFGSYYNMDFNEYQAGVKAMMEDSEFLYNSLTKDIFWQGKVLGRKYRLLRTAYSIFMYGIIVSVISFVVAIILM